MRTILLQLFMAAGGCLGFSIVFHIRIREWPCAVLGGIFSWGAYLLSRRLSGSDYLSAFLGASAAAAYGEMIARRVHVPATVFTVISSIPLIPGASLYRTADALTNHQAEAGKALGTYTLIFSASMSAGIVITSLICRRRRGKLC